VDKADISLQESEAEATRSLAKDLSPHVHLADRALDLAASTLDSLPPQRLATVPKSRRVASSLMARLMNDLRCVEIVVTRGYAIQGISLGGAIYETAFTIAYIGGDEEIAQEWIDHDNPVRPFRDARTLTKVGLANLGIPNPEGQAKTEYRVYQQMCMAKHANPLLQMEHSIKVSNKTVEIFSGPETSEAAIRASWFALEHSAALLAIVASYSVIKNHVPEEKRPPLVNEFHVIGTLRKRLEKRAKERWGTKDPFEGKW